MSNFYLVLYSIRQMLQGLLTLLIHLYCVFGRHFIVIDDVWDIKSWQALESALHQKDNGSRVVKTT